MPCGHFVHQEVDACLGLGPELLPWAVNLCLWHQLRGTGPHGLNGEDADKAGPSGLYCLLEG